MGTMHLPLFTMHLFTMHLQVFKCTSQIRMCFIKPALKFLVFVKKLLKQGLLRGVVDVMLIIVAVGMVNVQTVLVLLLNLFSPEQFCGSVVLAIPWSSITIIN